MAVCVLRRRQRPPSHGTARERGQQPPGDDVPERLMSLQNKLRWLLLLLLLLLVCCC